MEFIEKASEYKCIKQGNKTIDELHKEEKAIFETLLGEKFISNYYDFFASLRNLFSKMCCNRKEIYKTEENTEKNAEKNSYFYKNVHNRLGSQSEDQGGIKNAGKTNAKLYIGQILSASWPPNDSSSLKKKYREALKKIGIAFLRKNKKAYDFLSGLIDVLQATQSENRAKSLKKIGISIDFDPVKGTLLPVMKGYDDQSLKKTLSPILVLVEKIKQNTSINVDEKIKRENLEALGEMQQSLLLDSSNKPVTDLKNLSLEWSR